MEFADLEWMKAFIAKCNSNEEFITASKFADTKIVMMFGDKRYYLKLYKGKIIDLEEFIVSFAPLGYDFSIRAPMDVWESIRSKKTKFWDHYNSTTLEVGGNHMDAHRLHEAIILMCQYILPTV